MEWLIATSLRSLWSLWSLWSQKKSETEEKINFLFFKNIGKKKKKIESPTPTGYIPKRVSVGLPRRVLDVTMREFSSLFAGI